MKKDTLKNWFSAGKKPTGEQFSALIDSFVHKDENISLEKIEGYVDFRADVNKALDANFQDFFDKKNKITGSFNFNNILFERTQENAYLQLYNPNGISTINLGECILEGINIAPNLVSNINLPQHKKLMYSVLKGQNILTKLDGETYKPHYLPAYERTSWNDYNVMFGEGLATTSAFKTSENNIIFGKHVCYDAFGDIETQYHAEHNVMVGFDIQNYWGAMNKNPNNAPFENTGVQHNTMVGHQIYGNRFYKSIILGSYKANEFQNSICIGHCYIPGSPGAYQIKAEYKFDHNIIISNIFRPDVYKTPETVSNYLYIGNDTPLIEGNLSSNSAEKRIKLHGRLQIDGTSPYNNAQGDDSYTKTVVAKPDGTIGIEDKKEFLKKLLEQPDIKIFVANYIKELQNI